MKKLVKRTFFVIIMIFVVGSMAGNSRDASAKAKVKKVTMHTGDLKTYFYYNAKKVKITVSNKGIVTAKENKNFSAKNVKIRAKKSGTVTVKCKVTLKSGKKKTYKYQITVKRNLKKKSYTRGTTESGSEKNPVTTKPVKTIVPTVTPSPTAAPTETEYSSDKDMVPKVTETPYQAKYTYDVEVLNKFTIYDGFPVVLYVKTDNPNPNDFDNVYVLLDGESDMMGWDYSYEDIQYIEQEETNTTLFNKVNGGWIYTVQFSTPGSKTVKIKELEKRENSNNIWQTVDTFQIEVQDRENALYEYCNNLIDILSNDNYLDDNDTAIDYSYLYTSKDDWSELDSYNKVARIKDHIKYSMNYPRYGGLMWNGMGYKPIWYIQENVGAYWETGFADCQYSNNILCMCLNILGYEARLSSTTVNGVYHLRTQVIIDGESYYFDATPYAGGYGEWEYITLPE